MSKTASNELFITPGFFWKNVIIIFFQPRPTVTPFPQFNAGLDGDALRAAMKGFGTDEQTIIDILTARSNAQRQQIVSYFTNSLERDLIKDLKSELGGKFEDVIVGLMMPPEQYLCKQLNKAMKGIGTDESALIEIICTKSNQEIKRLVGVYEDSKFSECFLLNYVFTFKFTSSV